MENLLNQTVVGTPRMPSGLNFFMVRMPQYILIFHNDNCDQACSYSRQLSLLKHHAKKMYGGMDTYLLTFLKSEQKGQLHTPAIVLSGTFWYVTWSFMTVFTSVHHLNPFADRPLQSTPSHPALRLCFKMKKLFSVDHNYFIHQYIWYSCMRGLL